MSLTGFADRSPVTPTRLFLDNLALVAAVIRDRWPDVYRHLTPADRSNAGAIKWTHEQAAEWHGDGLADEADERIVAEHDLTEAAPDGETPEDAARTRADHRWWHDDEWQERDRARLDGSPAYDRARNFHREGERGLWRAIETFRPDRGARFSTWAYRCIVWAIQNHIQQEIAARDKARDGEVAAYSPELQLPPIGIEDLLSEFPWRHGVEPTSRDYVTGDLTVHAMVSDQLQQAIASLSDPVWRSIVCERLGIAGPDEWGDWTWDAPQTSRPDLYRKLELTRQQYRLRERRAMTHLRRELERRFRILGLI